MTLSIRTMLAAAVLIVAGAAVVGGFLVVGSPAEARLRRLDERRLSDLRQAASAVNVYWTRTHALPGTLADALKESAPFTPLADPVTGQPYEYRALTGSPSQVVKEREGAFELCATFDRASEGGSASYSGDPFWSHASGRQCFAITARDLSKAMSR